MKTKLLVLLGIFCLAIIAYEFRARSYLWNAIMDGTSGHNREKYMALREVFLKRYGDENIYQITNLNGVTGVSILLGLISILFFLLVLNPREKSPVKSKINIIKKIILIVLLLSASVITTMNLWTLM